MEPLTPGLYLVATPLGNLGDMSARAHDVLSRVDVIACEDTREMKKLLSLIGVDRGERNIVSLHEHNERERSGDIIQTILGGASVAYASDAGMPAISDPGAYLVDAAHEASVMVTAVPGATAVASAVALSGFTSQQFSFLGFFPRESKEKKALVEIISTSRATVVFYESPKRLSATLRYLADELHTHQRVVVCRELTKKFEEVIRGSLADIANHFSGEVKGECVVVIEANGDEPESPDETAIRVALSTLRQGGVSSRDAVNALTGLTEIPKNRLKEIYASILDD
ncbi:MAG TPA: 16S rRNA (cytidine(1402)-2'-O)-methyltransferase [Acidimicrobiia bacterium]|nr:16S rRNA (cytidine(1402)-2'-O)-methyltransferase [Acidimicrobiia bacterium]